jgi:transglutaminase-like putative cysteine protease
MKMKLLTLVTVISAFLNVANAQSTPGHYSTTDNFIQKLGSLDSLNVARITDTLTRRIPDKEQKARAIFYWIAHNIAWDIKAMKSGDQRKSNPEDVIRSRKATPLGFAKLFQEMSSAANIRCLVVDGYIKNYTDDINNPADEINHSWNVVQLGTSPDQWFFVDAARASGSADRKMSVYTPAFTSNYFFPEKALFNLDHFPDNDAWQLGGGPKSKKDFYALPVIDRAAYTISLKKPVPASGFIKARTKTKVNFSFAYDSEAPVSNVSLLVGEGKKMQKPEPMNFTAANGTINFSYQFKTEDTIPVAVLVDGKEVLHYLVEVTE